MFKILNKMFGNPSVAIGIIVNCLLHLEISKTSEYDRVFELCSVVNKYKAILETVSSEAVNYIKYNSNVTAHCADPSSQGLRGEMVQHNG